MRTTDYYVPATPYQWLPPLPEWTAEQAAQDLARQKRAWARAHK